MDKAEKWPRIKGNPIIMLNEIFKSYAKDKLTNPTKLHVVKTLCLCETMWGMPEMLGKLKQFKHAIKCVGYQLSFQHVYAE